MRALSIQQPWAYLIVNGLKDIENRSWLTGYRGPFYIHTGKMPDPRFQRHPVTFKKYLESRHNITLDLYDLYNAPRGGIVGIAELTDCVDHSSSTWFEGPFGFVIENARPIKFRSCMGMLGFFDVMELHDFAYSPKNEPLFNLTLRN